MNQNRRPNHLQGQTSPYLLQHLHNPVDWYPWGEEALARAQSEDRPIFLSIGYSACHWCHVMERESFEDEAIAAFLNEHFISIKVDREERPDLDEIYMTAVQLMTGSGGWPMSVFLTPKLKPFFGGTYYPPTDRYGRPGFRTVLERIAQVYKEDRHKVEQGADAVTTQIESVNRAAMIDGTLTDRILDAAAGALGERYDAEYGGFGSQPKFPNPTGIQLLLRRSEKTGNPALGEMALRTLDKMAAGGIYDHLGGGFHRYSVDARWLVPHFEKMLYDQAMLVPAYLEAALITGGERYEWIVREVLDYVLREMTSPEGGFYATQDADSEGEEGRFFVWTPEEVREVLGNDLGPLFARAFDVTQRGNFEGKSILHPVSSVESLAADTGREPGDVAAALIEARRRLFQAREKRVKPHRDEKILAGWNGIMIAALARGAQVLGDERYGQAAGKAAGFILEGMRNGSGLLRVYAQERAHQPGFLEDYAGLLLALVELHQYDFEPRWLHAGVGLAEEMIRRFGDPGGGFYDAPEGAEDLVVRPRSIHDGSVPSGNAMAAHALLRLGRLTGRDDLEAKGEETLRAAQAEMDRIPTGMGLMLLALDLYLGPRREIVIAGPEGDDTVQEMLQACRQMHLPRAVILRSDGDGGAEGAAGGLLNGKTMVDGRPAAYVCTGFACDAPVTSAGELKRLLE